MKKSTLITNDQVKHVAKLANLIIEEKDVAEFQIKLQSVLGYVKLIQEIQTDNVVATTQVTGLTNIFREDQVEEARMFTQAEALVNASESHQGFFMVPAILKAL